MTFKYLHNHVASEEFDYLLLKSILSEYYAHPRNKIKSLLRSRDIVRIKKGLYILGEHESLTAYSKEVLANLIYGPSAISLEYMLSLYGMIPERVEVVTSITSGRDKRFHTPVGVFSYKYIHLSKYAVGITQIKQDANHFFVAATPEKALSDKILLSSVELSTESDVEKYLFEDLRIYEKLFFKLNKNRLNEIKKVYQDERINLLAKFLNQKRGRKNE